MKKAFCLLFCFAFSSVQAVSVELELLRTKQVPGFFSLTMVPPTDLAELNIQNVFVKSYPKKQKKAFESIQPLIDLKDGIMIEEKQLEEYRKRADVRLVFLGLNRKYPQELQFIPEDEATIFEAFDRFANEFLEPVYLQNVRLEHGGNVSEIYPTTLRFITDKPATFVGKFENAMRTRGEIVATSHLGEVIADIPLELQDEGLIAKRNNLPEIWDQYRIWQERTEILKPINDRWLNMFPYLLAFIGIGLVLWGLLVVRQRGSEDKLSEILDEIEQEKY